MEQEILFQQMSLCDDSISGPSKKLMEKALSHSSWLPGKTTRDRGLGPTRGIPNQPVQTNASNHKVLSSLESCTSAPMPRDEVWTGHTTHRPCGDSVLAARGYLPPPRHTPRWDSPHLELAAAGWERKAARSVPQLDRVGTDRQRPKGRTGHRRRHKRTQRGMEE